MGSPLLFGAQECKTCSDGVVLSNLLLNVSDLGRTDRWCLWWLDVVNTVRLAKQAKMLYKD